MLLKEDNWSVTNRQTDTNYRVAVLLNKINGVRLTDRQTDRQTDTNYRIAVLLKKINGV